MDKSPGLAAVRVKRGQAILDKLDPPAPKPVPLPSLKSPGAPSVLMMKKRARRR